MHDHNTPNLREVDAAPFSSRDSLEEDVFATATAATSSVLHQRLSPRLLRSRSELIVLFPVLRFVSTFLALRLWSIH